MSAAADRVLADDRKVSDALTAMVQLVISRGGTVHPGARLEHVDGHLGVTCDPAAAPHGTPLFSVPVELLVPVTGAEWSTRRDTLELTAAPQGLTADQQVLLELFIELYNAMAKVPRTAVEHPRAAELSQDLVAAVRQVQPTFRATCASPAQVLIGCRVFGLADAIGEKRQQVLMPLIDALDHSPRGAPYRVDSRAMTMAIAQPFDHTCFANYGHRRDALGQALHYGYVDKATPFAVSASVTVEVDGLGLITVGRSVGRRAHRTDPPRVHRDPDGRLHISHAVFDADHPERLRTVLSMAATSAAAQGGASPAAAAGAGDRLMTAIVAANLDLLDRVASSARAVHGPAATTIGRAAEAQAAVITACAAG